MRIKLLLLIFTWVMVTIFPAHSCNEHAPEEYVSFNMRQLQVMLELYAGNHRGQYPATLKQLVADSQKNQYYRHLINPFQGETTVPFPAYKEGQPSGVGWRGVVGYVPIYIAGKVRGYRIYGGDRHGRPLLAGQDKLILRN